MTLGWRVVDTDCRGIPQCLAVWVGCGQVGQCLLNLTIYRRTTILVGIDFRRILYTRMQELYMNFNY